MSLFVDKKHKHMSAYFQTKYGNLLWDVDEEEAYTAPPYVNFDIDYTHGDYELECEQGEYTLECEQGEYTLECDSQELESLDSLEKYFKEL